MTNSVSMHAKAIRKKEKQFSPHESLFFPVETGSAIKILQFIYDSDKPVSIKEIRTSFKENYSRQAYELLKLLLSEEFILEKEEYYLITFKGKKHVNPTIFSKHR